MSKGKDLLKNTLIYTIGSIGSKVLSFALLPIYSFYLTKDKLGVYDLILTTISLVVPIITLQLSQANYRWLLDAKNDNDTKKAVSTAFFSVTLLISLFVLFYIFLSRYFAIPYEKYFILLLITTSYFNFFQDYSRGIKKNKLYAATGIVYSLGLLFFTIIFLILLKWEIEGILLASIISYAISIVIVLINTKVAKDISWRFVSKEKLKLMLHYSGPLIPNTISWWLINASNRYIILWGMDIEANGLFAVAARFPGILNIINSIFMLAWQDHTIQNSQLDGSFSGKIFELYYKMELSVTIILIACSKYIVKYFFSETFFESWKFMGILFLASAFSAFGAYYGAVYLREKKTIGLFSTTILGGLINIIFSFLLIKQIGLFAPAVGSLLGFTVVFIARKHQTKLYFNISYNQRLFTILCFIAFGWLFLSLIGVVLVDIAIIFISILLALYLNKEFIQRIFQYITPLSLRK